MKAIIGQFYKNIDKAAKRAKELKKMWKGRVAFVVIGGKNGFLVVSESTARACGINVPLKMRRY